MAQRAAGGDRHIGMVEAPGPAYVTRPVTDVAATGGGNVIRDHAVRRRVGAATGTKVAGIALAGARRTAGVAPLRRGVPRGGLDTVTGKAIGAKLGVQEGRRWSGAGPTRGVATRIVAARSYPSVINATACPRNAG